ncbi:hypothetical protein JCM6882_007683 [Rhodosporidiobolus microsporus]
MVYIQPGKPTPGLSADPGKLFKSCVVPRPIGWLATTNENGTHNLAPFSQFNHLSFDPPFVMVSINQKPGEEGGRKDTTRNIEREKEFTWSLATFELREAVNITGAEVPYGIDEFKLAGVEKEFGKLVKAPMFECRYHSSLRLPGNIPEATVDVIIGEVIGIHIDDDVLVNGRLDLKKMQPIARCGGANYAVVREDNLFQMVIPTFAELQQREKSRVTGSEYTKEDEKDVKL